jgi:hypothetical protein
LISNYKKWKKLVGAAVMMVYTVPEIKEIYGMECCVFFHINIKEFTVIINSRRLCCSENQKIMYKFQTLVEYSKGNIEKIIKKGLEKFIDMLPKLVFNTLYGKFTINNKICYNNIYDFQNTKLYTIEKCCVCFEPTMSITHCSHPLCYICATKINKDPDTHDIKCPLCRRELIFSTSEGDCDFESDSDYEADSDSEAANGSEADTLSGL